MSETTQPAHPDLGRAAFDAYLLAKRAPLQFGSFFASISESWEELTDAQRAVWQATADAAVKAHNAQSAHTDPVPGQLYMLTNRRTDRSYIDTIWRVQLLDGAHVALRGWRPLDGRYNFEDGESRKLVVRKDDFWWNLVSPEMAAFLQGDEPAQEQASAPAQAQA